LKPALFISSFANLPCSNTTHNRNHISFTLFIYVLLLLLLLAQLVVLLLLPLVLLLVLHPGSVQTEQCWRIVKSAEEDN
jgi:hypothetical protein